MLVRSALHSGGYAAPLRPQLPCVPTAPQPCLPTFFSRGSMTDRSVEAPSCLRDTTVGAGGARGAASVSVTLLGPSCRPCWLRGASCRRTGRAALAREGRPGRRAGGSGRHWPAASAARPAIGMGCGSCNGFQCGPCKRRRWPDRTNSVHWSSAPSTAHAGPNALVSLGQPNWAQTHQDHDTMEEREGHPGSERWGGRPPGRRGAARLALPLHRHKAAIPYRSAGGRTTSPSPCRAARPRQWTGGARRRVGPAGRWIARSAGVGALLSECTGLAAAPPPRAAPVGRYPPAAFADISMPHPAAADRGVQHTAQGEHAACQAVEAGPQPGQPGPEPRPVACQPWWVGCGAMLPACAAACTALPAH